MRAVLFLFMIAAFAANPAPASIDLLDLTPLLNESDRAEYFEQVHFLTALAGLANRNAPSVYTTFTPADTEWLAFLQTPGQWLCNATLLPVTSWEALVAKHASVVRGAVLYDPDLPSLSNLASTAAGVEGLLPVANRPGGTIYQRFVASKLLSVVRHLNSSAFTGQETGSRKGDAYMFAKRTWLDTGLANAAVMGFYVDYFWVSSAMCCGDATMDKQQSTITNLDYAIAKAGFFWDLDVWPDEAPNDDPKAPVGTDLVVLQAILAAAYAQLNGSAMIHIQGFTPWAYKYVAPFGQHGGVETEWQTALVLSSYNAFIDADACCGLAAMANAAFYAHYPTAAAEQMYAKFSWNGITEQFVGSSTPASVNGILVVLHQASDIFNLSPGQAATAICAFNKPGAPHFAMFRSILESAGFMAAAAAQANTLCGIEFVSPHEAAFLARLALGNNNDNIVFYAQESLPRALAAGSEVGGLRGKLCPFIVFTSDERRV